MLLNKVINISIVLFALFSLGGNMIINKQTNYNENITNKNWVTLKNNALEVFLDANYTTGYIWTFEIDNNILICEKEEYKTNKENTQLCGVGGIYCAKFISISDGNVNLIFKYKRNWESKEILKKQIALKIENGIISIISAQN